jgi:hypothetical protein
VSNKDNRVRVRFVIQGTVVRIVTRKTERTKIGATRPTGVSLVKAGADKEE